MKRVAWALLLHSYDGGSLQCSSFSAILLEVRSAGTLDTFVWLEALSISLADLSCLGRCLTHPDALLHLALLVH